MKTKRYTKEDIDKIPPFYGNLSEECCKAMKEALDVVEAKEAEDKRKNKEKQAA